MSTAARKRRPSRPTKKASSAPAKAPRKRTRRGGSASKRGSSKRSPIKAGQTPDFSKAFWGEAWCTNLAGYSEFAHRLPRGMELVHEGAVVDLQVGAGRVAALVRGEDTFKVFVTVAPFAEHRWNALIAACAGGVGSVEELLGGAISKDAMDIVRRREEGLLPTPAEIQSDCSCPEKAKMCEHIAAVLYGIGVRIAGSPDLLFALRRVDPSEMVVADAAAAEEAAERTELIGVRVLEGVNLSELFGIQIDDGSGDGEDGEGDEAPSRGRRRRSRSRSRSRSRKKAASTEAAEGGEGGESGEGAGEASGTRKRRRRRSGRRSGAKKQAAGAESTQDEAGQGDGSEAKPASKGPARRRRRGRRRRSSSSKEGAAAKPEAPKPDGPVEGG